MGTGTRSRDQKEWIVHGRKHGQPWVIPVVLILMGVLVVMTYQRFMAFDSVTYELRQCQTPLTAESTWAQVQAANCEPLDTAGATFAIYEGASRHDPDVTEAHEFLFDSFPINSVEHSVDLRIPVAAASVVVGEPDNEQVRRALSPDAAGKHWTGYTGDRGPTHYWLLVTPRP